MFRTTDYEAAKAERERRGIIGWLTYIEEEWLLKTAASHYSILEIGCWRGRSTFFLCAACLGQVTSVDSWEGTPEGCLTVYQEVATKEGSQKVYMEARKNLEDFILKSKLVLFKSKVAEAYPELRSMRMKFDMAFIDGDHEQEAVENDIANCIDLLCPGGLLCGHDCYPITSGSNPGVRAAVKKLLPDFQVVPATSIWYWRKH